MIILLLVVFGLVFGSFVNALTWRLHEQEELSYKKGVKNRRARLRELSIWHGRSMCPHCHHQLAAKDLVPVASWLWLRGKCRYCYHKIEDSPAIEVVTVLLFVVSYLFWPTGLHGLGLLQFCVFLAFLVGFVALAVYDLRWFLLPDRIVFPLIGLAVVELLATLVFFHGGWGALGSAILGVAISSGLFFALYQVSHGEWIGGGDVKLGIVLGILVGGPMRSLLLLFVASAFGTIVSLPLLAAGRANKKTLIPFGPFLLAAAVIIMLFGGHFTNWLNRFVG